MTTTQLGAIKGPLAKWRAERGLTIEGQREGLTKNLYEEFKEFLMKATKLKESKC